MALPVTILALATASPPFNLDQVTALNVAREALAQEFADFERMSKVFATTGIAHRQLAKPVDWYQHPRDFPERARAYLECACDLYVDAATNALAAAGLPASSVDTVVTASSTGIATPSLDAMVMARLGFSCCLFHKRWVPWAWSLLVLIAPALPSRLASALQP